MSIHFDFSKFFAPLGIPTSPAETTTDGLSVVTSYFNRLEQARAGMKHARVALRAEYERRRRCTQIKADGQPCKAWAVWHLDEQRCIKHLSPSARVAYEAAQQGQPRKTPRPTCACAAYPFPHRPGNALCIAPQKPLMVHPLPAGQRRAGRQRRREVKRIRKKLSRDFGGLL